jgi:type I restriction enzyme S subunit
MLSKPISKIAKRVSSGLTPLRSNPDFWKSGTIPWLKTEQLGEKYIYETSEKISELALRKTSIKVCPENTLSIAMYGEGKTRGNVSIIKSEMATNQACCNVELDPELADYEYVYYFLKTQYDQLRNLSSGVRKNLNSNDIKNFVIRLPKEVCEQTKIAAVLSALDAKIACNNRINAELEATAKTLYDYWFVQFDFPDANGIPYCTSGGKMTYNPTLKREIPMGWGTIRLNELLQSRTDSITAFKVDSESPYTPIDALPMKKMSFGAGQPSSEANSSLIQYKENDILIGAMRVYFHRVCIAPFDGITRTTVIVLRPNEPNHLPFLYQVCNEDRTINIASKISVGTQQPYVNWENALENHSIPYPENNVLIQKYSSMMLSVTKNVITREKENAELAKLRDWLLPMLMNGQVTVA